MKKILLLGFIFCAFISKAQTKITKDSLVKVMAKDVCDELNKNTKESKVNNLQEKLGLAMLPVFEKYQKEIKQVYGFTEINETSGEKIGEDIGEKLGTDCPIFMRLILDNPEATKEIIGLSDKLKSITFIGTLLKINTSDFTYLEIKTSNGKMEKLYWMEYFEGSNDLLNNPNKLINKKVKVDYVEKEIYKASIKEYVKIKIITGFHLN